MELEKIFRLGMPKKTWLHAAIDPDSDYRSTGSRPHGLEEDYEKLILSQLLRMGLTASGLKLQVRRIGAASNGYDVFIGMVKLEQWDPRQSARLLLGIPLIEKKVRKTIRATWLADYSHFAGLWFHASETMLVPDDLAATRAKPPV